jgi:DNA-nicking Smr family endonuclease
VVKKTLTQDDVSLFRQSIGKVSPVKSGKTALGTKHKPKPYPKQQSIDVTEKMDSTEDITVENLGLEDSFAYTAPGVQKNVLKKMRKGHYGLDAELDLHGLSSSDAKFQLLHFLHNCIQDGFRCVHIIHGKGYRSPDNQPVLKNKINLWLRQHQDVQAFCSATQRDGGTGAAYILLRLSQKYREQDDS